jgi:hypothetical protein
MIRVLSRELDRSMLGFSMEVAKLVTQPFCRTITRQPLIPSITVSNLVVDGIVAGDRSLQQPRLIWGSTYVALEGALENQLLSHVEVSFPGVTGGSMVEE